MDACMYGCMHVYMYVWMDACIHACMHVCTDACMDGQMDGWIDGWMDACMHYVEDPYIAHKLQIQCFKRLEACQATQRVERHLCLGSLSQADGAGIGEKNVLRKSLSV